MQISAALVKELRERSGAGMMECKSALVATHGDLEAAFEHLRKSGAAKAAKKAGRIAAEGAIVVREKGPVAVIVEVNSETDFVANDENFVQFVNGVADTLIAHKSADIEALNALMLAGTDETIETARQNLVAKIGENISVRRFAVVEAAAGALGAYLHGKRIGVLVELEGGNAELARDIAMHVAASNPVCVAESDVPQALLDKEREIRLAQAATSGKPADIVEKMVTGQIKKFIAESTLLGQPFVKDPETSVGKLVAKAGAKVKRFIRFEVGEGIEKKAVDFAEEVAAQARAVE